MRDEDKREIRRDGFTGKNANAFGRPDLHYFIARPSRRHAALPPFFFLLFRVRADDDDDASYIFLLVFPWPRFLLGYYRSCQPLLQLQCITRHLMFRRFLYLVFLSFLISSLSLSQSFEECEFLHQFSGHPSSSIHLCLYRLLISLFYLYFLFNFYVIVGSSTRDVVCAYRTLIEIARIFRMKKGGRTGNYACISRINVRGLWVAGNAKAYDAIRDVISVHRLVSLS